MHVRSLGLVVAAGLMVTNCQSRPAEPGQQVVRLVTGHPGGGGYYPLGHALARVYTETIPEIQVAVESTPGSSFNVDALNRGEADIGFSLADHAYRAYVHGTRLDDRPHTNLRGVAVVFESVVHLAVRKDRRIRRLADFEGARIGYGAPPFDVPRPTSYADVLLASGAVGASAAQGVRSSFDEMPAKFTGGAVDVWMVMSGYPFKTLSTLASDVGIRLIEIDEVAAGRIRARYPFYKPTVIPAGTYPGQGAPISTIAVDNLLLCREDLDPDLVYRLTKVLFESLSRLAQDQALALNVNPDVASATPIPLHPGSARYYRERELLQ